MPRTRPKRSAAPGAGSPVPATIPSVPLPGGGPEHPVLGLGTWNRGRWSHAETERAQAVVEHALARGIRWLDTAEVYGAGRSERIVGAALERNPDLSPPPFVATKVSWEHLRPLPLRAALQGSLERLGRPVADLYLVHAPDPKVPIAETMGELAAQVEAGRIRSVGVSNFSVAELEAAQAAFAPRAIAVNQVSYSLLDREDGDALLEHCARTGVRIEAYSPLYHGLLAGRPADPSRIPAAVRRGVLGLDPDHLPRTLAAARALRAIADRAGVPLAAIALHWLRRQGALPVFGASRPEQVDAALAAWATEVPPEVLDRADAASRDGGGRA
ncbi:MAG: aldo/keto reductase [Thermoplasmata archaeon]